MKKVLCIISMLIFSLICGACTVPDDMQMDVYLGAAKDLKLLHVNASSSNKEKQIQKIYEALTDAEPTDKPIELFAFYPDYTIEVDDLEAANDQRISVVLDINHDRLEFYYIGDDAENPVVIYRSNMSVEEFKSYMHMG